MSSPSRAGARINSLKIKAKLLQKAKKRAGLEFALKDAFELLARSAGYPGWREYKEALERHEALRPPSSAMWHVWYGSYDEAKAHLDQHSGYLVPFEKHFFIADEHYLTALGLDPADPDIGAVGRDWANPADNRAWQAVLKKLK
jgi:hypothetical protein